MNQLLVIAIVMVIFDAIYINAIGKIYGEQVAKVQRTALIIKWEGAIARYILMVCGIYYFIIKDRRPVLDAFLLGILVYGVYGATTYSIFKKWSPPIAIVDTLWGGVMFALTTMITYQIS
jgi:uncharacterized membrane protein